MILPQVLRIRPSLSLTIFSSSSKSAMSTLSNPTEPKKAKSLHEFEAKDIDGNVVKLDKYKGHPLVVVNVATKCGYTDSNYKQLQELFAKYSEEDKGNLRILAFPCNQFGGQESGSEEEIKNFAKSKYDVGFDLFGKVKVNGGDEHPLFTFLKAKEQGFLLNAIKWNFTKFVVDKEGNPVARFGPNDEPIPKVEEKVKELIGKN